jgi:hypothetical protein
MDSMIANERECRSEKIPLTRIYNSHQVEIYASAAVNSAPALSLLAEPSHFWCVVVWWCGEKNPERLEICSSAGPRPRTDGTWDMTNPHPC